MNSATFVLVHGTCAVDGYGPMWHQHSKGLDTTPTVIGQGERRHLPNEMATLSAHVEAIVAHIEMKGFQDETPKRSRSPAINRHREKGRGRRK
jgi:hypothetical protein